MHSATPSPAGADPALSRRWLLGVCMFLSVASFGFLEPFVPLYLEQSGLGRGQIGLVSGIGVGLSLLVQPLLGRLSDRIDARRPIMLAAALAAGAAYLCYPRANGPLAFILLTAVGINGVIYLNTAAAVLVGRLTSAGDGGKKVGGAFASYRVWGSVGYVVISLVTGLLLGRALGAQAAASRETLTPVFRFGPLLFFLIAGIVWFLPDPKRAPVATAAGEPERCDDATAADRRSDEQNLRRFFRAHFLFIFAYTGSTAYLSLYLKSLGATPFWITGVFAAGVACEALLMTQVGKLSDRFGRRPLLALAFVFLPIRLLLYIPATGPLWVLFVQTIHGVNFGILVAVAVAFVNDHCVEERRGATQARMEATAGLASALGPAAGGWLAQQWGIPWTFGIMAGVSAVGAGIFLWKVRESLAEREPLHRRVPVLLRSAAGVLCVPLVRLARRPRLQNETHGPAE